MRSRLKKELKNIDYITFTNFEELHSYMRKIWVDNMVDLPVCSDLEEFMNTQKTKDGYIKEVTQYDLW